MKGVELLTAYHRAYRKALEIHHKWQNGDEGKLLVQAEALVAAVRPVADIAGPDWHRSQSLERHLNCLVHYLRAGEKDGANTDIDDLIYADLPGLCDELLRISSK